MSRTESGFTLFETAISCLLLALVTAAAYTFIDSQTKAESRAQAVVNTQEDVRVALINLSRDARSAFAIEAPTTTAAAGSSLVLDLTDAQTGASRTIRWRIDSPTGELVRETLTGVGGSTATNSYRLRGVQNLTAPAPVTLFRYFTLGGSELVAGGASPADIANCAARVHVAVLAATTSGPAPFLLESDVAIRGRLTRAAGC